MKELKESFQGYNIEIKNEKSGEKVVFSVLIDGEIKAIAKLRLKNDSRKNGMNFYTLTDINSFDKNKGLGSVLLGAINEFARKTNSIITASVRLERVNFFVNSGWQKLGSKGTQSVTMTYNFNNQ